MVFGGQNQESDSGVVEGGRPLPGIEFGRIEEFGVLVALPPFTVGEGIHAEVSEGNEFMALPFELLRAGHGERVRGQHRARREESSG